MTGAATRCQHSHAAQDREDDGGGSGADALSTAFMMVSEAEIDQYCLAHGVEAWILENAVSHFPVRGC